MLLLICEQKQGNITGRNFIIFITVVIINCKWVYNRWQCVDLHKVCTLQQISLWSQVLYCPTNALNYVNIVKLLKTN